MMTTEHRGLTAKGVLTFGLVILLLLALLLGLAMVASWSTFAAIEERFGANVAVLSFGGLLLLGAFLAGVWFGARSVERGVNAAHKAQGNFIDGLGELGATLRGTAAVSKEYARGEREAFSFRARADVADEQRVHRLAEQKARILIGDLQAAQRQAEAAARGAPTWRAGAEVPAASAGQFRVVE